MSTLKEYNYFSAEGNHYGDAAHRVMSHSHQQVLM